MSLVLGNVGLNSANNNQCLNRLLLIFTLTIIAQAHLFAQSDPQSLIKLSVQELSSKAAIADVTLSGTVTRVENGQTESGTIVMIATKDGTSSVKLTTMSGSVVQTMSLAADGTPVMWSTQVGNQVPQKKPVKIPSSTWFFPYFTLANLLTPTSGISITTAKHSAEDQQLHHLKLDVTQSLPLTERLKPVDRPVPTDVYLDPATSLPTAFVFAKHVFPKPGTPVSTFVSKHPILEDRIEFSNYQQLQGVVIPLAIRVLVQHLPYLDIQIKSIAINTGVAVSIPAE